MNKLLSVLAATFLVVNVHAANNLQVKLDVEGNSLATTTRLTEVFQSELTKIPDVALVNQGHWDLDVFVQGVNLDGILVFLINVADHEQLPLAFRDSGADLTKIKAILLSRSLEPLICGYVGLWVANDSTLHDVVANVIMKINKADFQACRNAVDLYGRIIAAK